MQSPPIGFFRGMLRFAACALVAAFAGVLTPVDAAAKRAIVHAGCSVGRIVRARSNRVRRGRVISQRPRPGVGLAELGPVNLVISKGRR